MLARRRERLPFIFELIRESFPQQEISGPRDAESRDNGTLLLMIGVGTLATMFGLLFGILSRP